MTHIGFPRNRRDSSRGGRPDRAARTRRGVIGALALAMLAACAPLPRGPAGTPEAPVAPAIAEDDLAGLAGAIEAQCRLARPPGSWPTLCAERPRETEALRRWLAARFEPVLLRAPDGADRGVITGYYEPVLTGSLRREHDRQVPLRRRPPPDSPLARAPRAQIEASAPSPEEVLAWADDAVAAYFLQIQGSGRLRLRDGSVLRVGYAGDNGQPYRAIGRDLIERGEIDASAMSAQAIAKWLRERPEPGRDLMRGNPRFVFFRELPPRAGREDTGPIGSLGVPLTPLRSIAVDPRAVPLGSLLWLVVDDPRGGQIRRLVLAQDTGSAIVGSPRADLFWGSGEAAGEAAGLMRSTGRLWLMRERR